MKLLIFLVVVIKLFGYELYVSKKSDALIAKNLGIECKETSKGFLCKKDNDLQKLLKLKSYLNNFGVNSYITKENILSGYCIQLQSAKNLDFLKNSFKNISAFEYARIEKIGKFYVTRVGESPNKKDLKSYLKKLKPFYENAFIRKCDYIPSRIVYPVKKKIDLDKLSKQELRELMYKSYLKGDYDLAFRISNLLKRSVYRKDALIMSALLLYKKGHLKKSCRFLEDLNDIYDDYIIYNHMKKICYEFYIKNAEEQISISPIRALFNVKKAIKLNDNLRAKKDLALIYFNIKEYNAAYRILKKIVYQTSDKNVRDIYANTLFSLNKFEKLENFCSKNSDLNFCLSYDKYKKTKFFYSQKRYLKAYVLAKKLYKLYPYNKNIKILYAKVLNKMHKIDEAMLVVNTIFDANEDVEVLALLRDIFYNQDDLKNAYKYASILEEKGVSDKENKTVLKEYFLYSSYKNLKSKDFKKALECLEYASRYADEDLEILKMKAKIFYSLKNYNKVIDIYNTILKKVSSDEIKKRLIDVYFDVEDFKKAREVALNSDKLIKNYFYLKYASFFIDEGEYAKAKEYLDKVNVYNQAYLKLKGIECFYLKDYKCAIKSLSGLDDDESNYYLIMSYISLGNYQKAKELLSNFKNKNKETIEKIGIIYMRLGESEKAKEILGGL